MAFCVSEDEDIQLPSQGEHLLMFTRQKLDKIIQKVRYISITEVNAFDTTTPMLSSTTKKFEDKKLCRILLRFRKDKISVFNFNSP